MPKNKAFNEIEKGLKQQKKDQRKLKEEDQGEYVDGNRNTGVALALAGISVGLASWGQAI